MISAVVEPHLPFSCGTGSRTVPPFCCSQVQCRSGTGTSLVGAEMVVASTLMEEVVSQLVGAEAEVSGGGGLSEKIKFSILRTYLHMKCTQPPLF